ncbi:MAG TPA: ThuA domain-containing protein [Acidobacteriaceae bacterium]|nr:ThuA domain-containing protein [Acidobacteriaceae bacterium]
MNVFRTKLSRRTLVQNAGVVAGAGLLGLGSGAVESQATPGSGKPRALALVGDRYHNPDYIRVSLDKVFQDLGIPIDYTIDYAQISAGLLKSYQLLVILRDGMIWPGGYLGPDAYTAYEADLETPKTFPEPKPVMWIREDQGAAIKDFVSAGNGFYALHNCSHISLSSKDYREVMGGAYIGHPPLRPFQVRATANKHPITDGVTPFIVNDEQHYVAYDKDPKYVILEAENIDGLKYEDLGTKSISGWAYDFGKGRVVFTAVGHTIHAMWNPQYIEIQKRSIRWLLREL